METFTLLGGKLTLKNTSPRPTEDPLWLAHTLHIEPNQKVLDAGCGTGIVGLVLALKNPSLNITGMDMDPTLCALAEENATLNNIPYTTQQGDFANPPFPADTFNHVVANLPFHAQTRGHSTPNTQKEQAHTLPKDFLPQWLSGLWKVTQNQLHTLIHMQEVSIVENWCVAEGIPFHTTTLKSHQEKDAKRIIFHIGIAGENTTLNTWDTKLRNLVLG